MTITASIYGQRFENILTRLNQLLRTSTLQESGIAAKLEQGLKEFRERGFLTIAFVGEYSSGKSSLISALTGRRDLAISADIATDRCCEYEWNGVKLIDTPGLWTERTDHDKTTYDAIAKADLLVYCLTYSLFDTTTLTNFKQLAFERNYQSKMLLLVNKMSAEAGDVEDRILYYADSLRKSLAPHALEQFPVAFCDARDQIDGEDEQDEELKALSRFDILNGLLNQFIADKGAIARLDTPLRIVLASLDDVTEACTRDTGRDDQQALLLKKLSGVVARQRRALLIKAEQETSELAYAIKEMGRRFARDVGVDPRLQEAINQSEYAIGMLCQKSSDRLQKELDIAVQSLQEEIGREFSSPLMADFINSNNTHIAVNAPTSSETSKDIKRNVATLKRIADACGVSATQGFVTAAQASKSGLATSIRAVGKLAGLKFNPWGAANLAKNMTNIVPYVGVALSVLSAIVSVTSMLEKSSNEEKIKKAKRDILNHFDNVAASISVDMRKALVEVMDNLYGEVEAMLSEMKLAYEKELGASNATIKTVSILRAESEELLKLIYTPA